MCLNVGNAKIFMALHFKCKHSDVNKINGIDLHLFYLRSQRVVPLEAHTLIIVQSYAEYHYFSAAALANRYFECETAYLQSFRGQSANGHFLNIYQVIWITLAFTLITTSF